VIGGLVLGALLTTLGACATVPPLDPATGTTGGPLTDNERATDVIRYELTLEILPDRKEIRGESVAVIRALDEIEAVELQLDGRFAVPEVLVDGEATRFERRGGVLSVALPRQLAPRDETRLTIRYSGRPHVAVRAPWEGGFVWAESADGRPWIATAVQGEGCDLWWPCKDHFADKPDRMDMHVTVPAGLSVALNGVLRSVEERGDGRRTFHWVLNVPISDYNISLNVGPFVRIQTSYESVNGTTVPIEFWSLPEHEEEARRLIKDDLRHQLAWYEATLGPYPWGGEKVGVVETPHLGMEHQTLNAYGNRFRRDPHGFDWLLQHELAHEWFGNLMTHARLNDAWLHEGFGAYMQPAYSLHRFGTAAYHHTMYEMYLRLENCTPVVPSGDPTSQEAFTPDIYTKGAWTLHTLRWHIGEEAFWRATRRLLYDTDEPWDLPFPIRPLYRSTEDFVRIASEEAGRDLAWLFDVYLRDADLPSLASDRKEGTLTLRWKVPGDRPFPMPVPIEVDGVTSIVPMTSGEGAVAIPTGAHLVVDPQMRVLRRLPIIGTCEEIRAERDDAE
jgi:aminopeptidase N